MDKIIKILEKNNIEHEVGIINNGRFISLPVPFKDKKVIKIKWIKERIGKLLEKLSKEKISVKCETDGNYYAIYKIENSNDEFLIEYSVNSHVQLPRLLLENFRTNEFMYYMNTSNNKLVRSSAGKYNTVFDFYPKWFEDYLSNNYEKKIKNLIEKIEPFALNKEKEISIENLWEDINEIFFMAFFRNPDQVKKVNDNSIMAKIIDGGITAENIAITCKEMTDNWLSEYKPLLIINLTHEGFLTLKCLFARLSLKFGNCILLSLHPKFGIVMVPNEYYSNTVKEYGGETFIGINATKTLRKINLNIYHSARISNNTDVIGIKDDLDNLLYELNNI